MARKDSNSLKVALQMREAVAYLAALASRSELEKIAHDLLRIHFKLGTQIDALRIGREENHLEETSDQNLNSRPKMARH